MELLFAIIGGGILLVIHVFLYQKGKKAIKFITTDCETDKRCRDFLMKFLLKFYLVTFGLVFLTFGAWGLAMGPFWFILLLVKWRFSKLWRASGYSLAFLIVITILFIVVSFIAAHFIRELVVIPLINFVSNLYSVVW